jgi:hypothetical protein
MPERATCRCPLCRIETELLAELTDGDRQAICGRVLDSAPHLSVFSGAGPLLTYLRLCHDSASSDAILRALVQAKDLFPEGVVERLFLLAFLPSLHASLRCATRRHPHLSLEDATQHSLQSLLRFLDSDQLRTRQNYLAYAIARRIKRSLFEWVERELRTRPFEADGHPPEMGSSENSMERLVFLRHFLDRAVRCGVLNEAELNLLIQFKLDNGFENGLPEGSSNAHRQRLKRLLAKLRHLAEGRVSARTRPASIA